MSHEINLQRRIERLETELSELRAELLAVSSQCLTLGEALAEESHIAGRILATIEKKKLRPEQFH
jgi:archaellum component FlaC